MRRHKALPSSGLTPEVETIFNRLRELGATIIVRIDYARSKGLVVGDTPVAIR